MLGAQEARAGTPSTRSDGARFLGLQGLRLRRQQGDPSSETLLNPTCGRLS